MIRISSDWSAIDAEIDRIAGMPDFKTQQVLDHILETGFRMTQAAVHVDTGSLKGSGKGETSVNRAKKTWTGKIRYGGPSTGVNNPVNYAIYEKRRDGDHDFMAPLATLDPLFYAAILKAMQG